MKRKLLSIVLTVSLVLTLCSAMCFTATADVSGTLTYEVVGNEVTITGYTGTDVTGALTIPATITGLPVTAIGYQAFSYTSITSLTVPTGVKTIEEGAFYSCSDLATINLADSVTYVGARAFHATKWYSNQTYNMVYVGKVLYECKSTTVTIVSQLSTARIDTDTVGIAESAFKNIDTLTTVHIPNSVQVIGANAFYHCDNLSYISLPTSLTRLGDNVFEKCNKLATIQCNFTDDLTQMSNLSTVGFSALTDTKWYEDKADGNVYFGKVYYKRKGGDSSPIVNITAGTKGIANSAFASCNSLSNIVIPQSVEHIGEYIFDRCGNLTTISVDTNNKNYYSSGSCLIEKATGKLLYGGKMATIPSGVKIIGDSAFYGRTNLENIDIPAGVTKIEDYAFGNCTKLKKVFIPSSVTEIGSHAFDSDEALTTVNYSCGEKQRAKITIGSDNTPLENATWNYHYGRKAFPDVNYKDWYGDAVEFAVGAGLIKGYANGNLGTTDGIQRQDFVVILSRLSGENIDFYAGKANFKDVPANAYYANALAWAKARGVSNGYTDGRFGVGDKVTREQIVTFLHNYAKLKGYSISYGLADALAYKKYPDYSSVSSWAATPITWGISRKIIGGKAIGDKKYLAPKANATRSEVAGMFCNIFMYDAFVYPVA